SRVTVGHKDRQELDEWAGGGHQGVVAEVSPSQVWGENMLDELLERTEGPALLLVLDGVTDPHNLGACLRTADAAGAQAVIVPKDKSATLNATVRKVACGAAEVIPLVAVTNLARTLEKLQKKGLWIVGTAGEADKELYDLDLSGPTVLVMGAEGKGMRRLTRERCDFLARLPMAGSVSSLNVSVATGVCLFEALRQRRRPGLPAERISGATPCRAPTAYLECRPLPCRRVYVRPRDKTQRNIHSLPDRSRGRLQPVRSIHASLRSYLPGSPGPERAGRRHGRALQQAHRGRRRQDSPPGRLGSPSAGLRHRRRAQGTLHPDEHRVWRQGPGRAGRQFPLQRCRDPQPDHPSRRSRHRAV